MSRGAKIGLGLVVAVVAVVVVGGVRGKGDGAVEVREEAVARRELVAAVTASGNIEAKSQVDVQSEVTARILRITVKEGDLVEKGQLLVELDQVQFRGNVESAEAQLTSQQTSLMQATVNRDQARRSLDRTAELKSTTPTMVSDEMLE